MNKNEVDFEKWLQEKEQSNAKRLEERLSKQGRSPYLRLDQGENNFTLLPEVPRHQVSNWGKNQEVFKVRKNDVEYDWPITVTSPMYIKVARQMPEAPVDLTVVRVGEGIQTRLTLIDK